MSQPFFHARCLRFAINVDDNETNRVLMKQVNGIAQALLREARGFSVTKLTAEETLDVAQPNRLGSTSADGAKQP